MCSRVYFTVYSIGIVGTCSVSIKQALNLTRLFDLLSKLIKSITFIS